MTKFVFTGGHHNSGLSVVQEIKKRKMGEVVWYGHKYTMLGDKNVSVEYQEVTKSDIFFRDLKAGKVYKVFNPIHWIRVPFGFFQAYLYLLKDQPDLVVSFGGYLATPVALAAWFQGIPIITHEQTTVVGLSNKFIAKLADKILVSWPQSKQYLPAEKVVVTGLPLRPVIFQFDPQKKHFGNNLPTIYLTGGKQGSHVLNEVAGEALLELLEKANLIHQCGTNTIYHDFDKLEKKKNALPEKLKRRYLLKKYFYEEEIGQIFHEADLVISRAGAHVVYELAALGLPALFVPIPWVSHREQYKNARLLVNFSSALILPEERLSKETLIAEVNNMLVKLDTYQKQAKQTKDQIVYNAKERFIDEICKLVEEKNPKKPPD